MDSGAGEVEEGHHDRTGRLSTSSASSSLVDVAAGN